MKKSKLHFVHCFLPVAEGWAGEPRSAASRRVSSSSELDLPPGEHCEAGGLLPLDVPLLRAQLRGSRLLDAMRMYRQGGALHPRAAPDPPHRANRPPHPGVWRGASPLPSPTGPGPRSSLSPPPLGSLPASLQLGLFLSLFLSILLIFLLFHSPALFIPAQLHPTCPVPTALSFPSPGLGRPALPTADPVSYWYSCL